MLCLYSNRKESVQIMKRKKNFLVRLGKDQIVVETCQTRSDRRKKLVKNLKTDALCDLVCPVAEKWVEPEVSRVGVICVA